MYRIQTLKTKILYEYTPLTYRKKGKDKPENHFQYITSQKSANSVEIGTVLAMFCLQKTGAENWVFVGAFDFLSHSYKKWTLMVING